MIDINSDMGELTHLFEDRTYHQLIDHVTSINLACGGHAGNTTMMTELSKLAKLKNVRIGAHPGYPDPDNLGRAVMNMDPRDLTQTILEQIRRLDEIVSAENEQLFHVKPHGALYNQAAKDRTYESDGSLRNRDLDHALITDPKKAAKQAQMITNEGKVISFDGSDIHINAQTICIHSDTPNALDIAKKVNEYINKE